MTRFLAGALLALLVSAIAFAQGHTALQVDILAGPLPQPVRAEGRLHLLYELRLTNFSPRPMELTGLDVLADGVGEPLASYRGAALDKLIAPIGPPSGSASARAIGAGRTTMVFLDLTLEPGARAPARLRHRLSFMATRKDGTVEPDTVEAPTIVVVAQPSPILRPPLSGKGWIAANALSNPDHRRAFVTVDGKLRIAQRFAVDWLRLGPDGRMLHGDPKSNASFYDYGADVLAVADGRVSELKDGLPQNAGNTETRAVPVTLETIGGNHLILDLGHGRFAVYAHLQPGSFRVKLGDRVKAGQVLARLGNSGNSDAPHLHFQLVDANSNLGAEGVPYELDAFTEEGHVRDVDALIAGEAWRPPVGSAPVVRRREFPTDKAVVDFR